MDTRPKLLNSTPDLEKLLDWCEMSMWGTDMLFEKLVEPNRWHFPHIFIFMIWHRMLETYGIAMDRETTEDLVYGVQEGWSWDELVHLSCSEYAEKRGWEEVM